MTYLRQAMAYNEAKHWTNRPILAEARRIVANYTDTEANRFVSKIFHEKDEKCVVFGIFSEKWQ